MSVKQQCRFVAIMFADIAGFTAMMGSDEEQAFQVPEKNSRPHITKSPNHQITILPDLNIRISPNHQITK